MTTERGFTETGFTTQTRRGNASWGGYYYGWRGHLRIRWVSQGGHSGLDIGVRSGTIHIRRRLSGNTEHCEGRVRHVTEERKL